MSGLIYAGLALCFAVVILANVLEYKKRKDIENEKYHLEEMVKTRDEQYKQLLAANKALGTVRQDILQQTQQLVRSEHSSANMHKKNSLTGNKFLDLILELKLFACEEKHIQFQYEISADCSCFPFSEVDTVALFQNLFENAIEACEKAGNAKILFVVRLTEDDGLFGADDSDCCQICQIIIKNSKCPDSNPIESGFHTTKQETEKHGRGMGIIRDIVDRYGGKIFWQDETDLFCTTILIRNIRQE